MNTPKRLHSLDGNPVECRATGSGDASAFVVDFCHVTSLYATGYTEAHATRAFLDQLDAHIAALSAMRDTLVQTTPPVCATPPIWATH